MSQKCFPDRPGSSTCGLKHAGCSGRRPGSFVLEAYPPRGFKPTDLDGSRRLQRYQLGRVLREPFRMKDVHDLVLLFCFFWSSLLGNMFYFFLGFLSKKDYRKTWKPSGYVGWSFHFSRTSPFWGMRTSHGRY